ncbi:MAG: hypothetical protein V1709_02810 [Planctomycetota bacterium]
MRITTVFLLILIIAGCNSMCFNNIDRCYQIYPVKEAKTIPTIDNTNKDKIIKTIFFGEEIRKANKEDEDCDYLVIGEKWAQSFIREEEADKKYVSIDSILDCHSLPYSENQIVVTLNIYTPSVGQMLIYHVAVVILGENKNKDNYKILAEYYDVGKTFAPSVAVDLNNDGLMEIALFQGQFWGHPWGHKFLNVLKSENNSLVNIMETTVNSFNYVLDTEIGTVSENYESSIEIDKNNTLGYCAIVKTGLQIWTPHFVEGVEELDESRQPVSLIKVVREIFNWDGKKYNLSSAQILLEYKPLWLSSEH